MLSLRDISHAFDGQVALEGVSATFAAGSVHGVLGENGAGKTTLMRIAAGLLNPNAGAMVLDGREMSLGSPRAAADAGIAMVHQHFCLVPTLTVAENCAIGRREVGQWVSRKDIASSLIELGKRYGLDVDPSARVETLSVGQQQRVEILRALSTATRVLILDEPTAVLTPQETEQLFSALDRLREQGLAIVFISHKLDEVKRICDELTILRRGKRVFAGRADELTTAEMTEHMVGRRVDPLPERAETISKGQPVLELRDLSVADRERGRRLDRVNLTVRSGEIVGIAGVEGNGQDLLAAAIVGMRQVDSGAIAFEGRDVAGDSIRKRAQAGIAHIAEDRRSEALVGEMTLSENLMLKSYASPSLGRLGLLDWPAIRKTAVQQLTDYDVRPPNPFARASQLSGGNQQKVVLARELHGSPKLVVAQNPVRGLDVAATHFVVSRLIEYRKSGGAVLLIHSDLDELLSVADRVYVLKDGRCIETRWPDADRLEIGRLMLEGVRT